MIGCALDLLAGMVLGIGVYLVCPETPTASQVLGLILFASGAAVISRESVR